MTPTWDGDGSPQLPRVSVLGWVRVALRGSALVLTILAGLVFLIPLRAVEVLAFGQKRPVTPWITRIVCRMALVIIGLKYVLSGKPMRARGALVANHSSWLDIFVLNASDCVYFVSKSDVAKWPGIGFLARVTGTVFIARDRREAQAQKSLFEDRLALGHRLLFFPEGTSTDGLRVLPFKSTLFAAFLAPHYPENLAIQPVSVTFHAPEGSDRRVYGWWGDMDFGAHLVAVLSLPRRGRVDVVYHAPLCVADFADRKLLALAAEQAVIKGHRLIS